MWQYIPTEELYHHGILGQKWGVRRYQNPDGTRTSAGKARRSDETLFVSGSSKTQDKQSEYYRKRLPKPVKSILNESIKNKERIIVGDAPGIDRQVQDFLKSKHYKNVEIYSPGKESRYRADKKWANKYVDVPGAEIGSKEWLAAKDFVMTNEATKGLAITLDEGSTATKNNVQRLISQNKSVTVYELSRSGNDNFK